MTDLKPASHPISEKGRKILLINPRFQLIFLGYVLGMSVLAIGVFYLANMYFFWKFSAMGVSLQLPENHAFFQFINEQKKTMNMVFAVTAFVSFVLLLLGALLLSHRVAGPLHRLNQHMLNMAAGRTRHDVQFRKGDFFQELSTSFNGQLAFWKGKKPEDKDSFA